MPLSPFSLRLADTARNDLDYISQLTHRSKSSVAAKILEEALKQKAEKMRAIQEAKEDLRSGELHSGKQITDWMDTWFTEDETKAPNPDTFR